MDSPLRSSRTKSGLSPGSKRLHTSTRTSTALTWKTQPPVLSTTTINPVSLSGDGALQTPSSSEPSRTLPPDSTLGQFSYAPATQTTVVTTTTTTTTSFPPLILKGPRHLVDLDPKLYPLASSPTPAALKNVCFELGGIPAVFTEADNASESLNEWTKQRESLDASHGILKRVDKLQPRFETGSKSKQTVYSKVTALASPTISSTSRKRPASSVLISESAELDRSQESRQKRRNTSRTTSLSILNRANLAYQTPAQSGDLARSSLTTPESSGIALADLNGPTRRWRLDGETQAQHPLFSTNPDPHETPSSLSPQSVPIKTVSFANTEDFSDTACRFPTDRTAHVGGDDEIAIRSSSLATATPPITDTDLQLAEANYGDSPTYAQLDPTSPANVAAGQDASLPSPSLSPVTAALNHGVPTSSEGVEHGDDLDSSFELPPPRILATQRDRPSLVESVGSSASVYRGGLLEKAKEAGTAVSDQSNTSLLKIPSMLDTFDAMPSEMQTYLMYQFLRRCSKPTLKLVAGVVNPALKVDFLGLLPLELSLNILRYLDFQSLCRAAQVSKKWRQLIDGNERAWKELFDRDGYTLPPGELQRAIREGWGWQIPHGDEDFEKDISSYSVSQSEAGSPTSSRTNLISKLPVGDSESALSAPSGGRPKRRTAAKSSSRKRLRKKDGPRRLFEGNEANKWMSHMANADAPYAAAAAAMKAVPNPPIGLPSLRSLHLFKSLYKRHCIIRRSWMQEDIEPSRLAFRAHGQSVVTCLQFDSEKILTGSDDHTINVYDTKTGALRTRLEGHEGGVWALQYEGNMLVSGSTDRSVRVWDIERGICTHVFQGHTSTVRCLQILLPAEVGRGPDGRPIMMPKEPLILTGSRDSTLKVWKLPQPGDVSYFPCEPLSTDTDCSYFLRTLVGHQHSVRAIAAYGDILVSGSYDCTVRVWKISTGDTLYRLQGHTQKVYSVVLDHERRRCISGSMDNVVKVWSLETGTVLFNLEGHQLLVGLLDLQHDRLVSAAADSTLRIWDPEFGRCRGILNGHTGAITCFQHDDQKVISGSDTAVKMWNVKTGKFLRDLITDLRGVWQVKFNERRCVAAVNRDGWTWIEVLDFGCARDAFPKEKLGQRIIVNELGQEISDPLEIALEGNAPVE